MPKLQEDRVEPRPLGSGYASPHYYGLILAGGRGTRFWPRSRRRSAKQVLNVVGARSLIQNTVDRLPR